MDQPLQKTVQNCRMRGLIVGMLFGACFPAWSAHAYAQFGDIKYPPGFQHFDYVNPKAPKGGEISLVPPTRLSNFDKYNPFTLKGSAPPSLVGLVFETLLTGTLDEPTTAYGLLAEDVAVAPDRLSVVFRLHPAARFSNGDPVLAADVKHSFDRLVSKESAPQYRTIFGEVRGATILGERTIRFDFKRVNAELPLIVGGLPVFSRQWGMEKGKAKPLDQIVTDMPIGSGPYRVGKVSFGRDITYERDPHYWAKDLNVRRGLFNFDRITYKIYKDNTAQLEAFKAGEFDYIQAFIAREWARAYSGKQFDSGQLIKKELKHGNAGDFQGFQFNTRRDKFKDPRVREAIGSTDNCSTTPTHGSGATSSPATSRPPASPVRTNWRCSNPCGPSCRPRSSRRTSRSRPSPASTQLQGARCATTCAAPARCWPRRAGPIETARFEMPRAKRSPSNSWTTPARWVAS